MPRADVIAEPEPVALIDMDNTIVDYSGPMTEGLNAIRSPQELAIRNHNPFNLTLPHMKARVRLIRNQPGWWANLPRLEIGFMILKELQAAKFSIHVLTKGPHKHLDAWSEKARWCYQHIPGIPVTITQEKSLVYGRILVDDWPGYYLPWLQVRPRGLVIVPAHPWNKEAKGPGLFRFTGTKDLPKLRELIWKQHERD